MIAVGFLLLLAGAVPAAPAQHEADGSPSMAARYVDPVSGMTLSELIAQAMARAPWLQGARLEVVAARHAVAQAGLRANPSVGVEYRHEPAGTDRQLMASAQWPMELFRRKARVTTATSESEAVAAGVEDRERLLRIDIEAQYGRLLAAVHHLVLLEELSLVSHRWLALIEARQAEGAIPRVERDAARLDAGRLDAQRELARGTADAELIVLKRLVGLSPSAPLKVRETLEQAVAANPPVERLPETASAARADIREAVSRVGVEAARTQQLRAEARFDVSLTGGYMRMDAGFPQKAFGPSGQLQRIRGVFHNAVIGAQVMVPLFNRNQGAIAAADSRRAAAERSVDAARLLAEADVAAAESRLHAARAALAMFNGPLRELARRNVDVMREAFELGRNPLLDVLAEQRRYLEVELAYREALVEAFGAQAARRAARGGFDK